MEGKRGQNRKECMLKILPNYLVLGICVAGFAGGAMTAFVLPLLQVCLCWWNYKCGDNWRAVLAAQVHLLISTFAGLLLEGCLYLKYISDDAESVMVFLEILRIGVILVLGLGVITTLVKYFFAGNGEKKSE